MELNIIISALITAILIIYFLWARKDWRDFFKDVGIDLFVFMLCFSNIAICVFLIVSWIR